MKISEQQEKILLCTMEVFQEKGVKFTMDDVAKRLGISKKTIYVLFADKEELIKKCVRYGFAELKISERKIIEDDSLSLVEKIKRIIIVLPDRYKKMDFRRIYEINEKYPEVYKEIVKRVENEWEPTIALLEEAMKEGLIRQVNIVVLKTMIEAAIEHFIANDSLIRNNISYEEALQEMIDITIRGIVHDEK